MEYAITDGEPVTGIAGLNEEDLLAMLSDVWATLFLPDGPMRTAVLASDVAPWISARAELQGEAENVGNELQLMVAVDRDAAGLLVGAFFGADGITSPAEVQDTVSELANMSAGAVKTLLDGEWMIGIPVPAEGDASLPGWLSVTLPVQAGAVRLALGPGAGDEPAA